MITITNETDITLNIEHLIQKILDILEYTDYDIGILIATPAIIQQYNRDYRNKDAPTDILSFPFHHDLRPDKRIIPMIEDDKNLGDILICPTYIKENLTEWQQSFDERLKVLLVHGICHLLGYDHEFDQDYVIMQQQENYILSKL